MTNDIRNYYTNRGKPKQLQVKKLTWTEEGVGIT